MKLSKTVPAHKKTIEFNWCKKDFMVIDERYRAVRKKLREPLDTCFWCGHKFIDGEMMGLAQSKKGTNKVLCQKCC